MLSEEEIHKLLEADCYITQFGTSFYFFVRRTVKYISGKHEVRQDVGYQVYFFYWYQKQLYGETYNRFFKPEDIEKDKQSFSHRILLGNDVIGFIKQNEIDDVFRRTKSSINIICYDLDHRNPQTSEAMVLCNYDRVEID